MKSTSISCGLFFMKLYLTTLALLCIILVSCKKDYSTVLDQEIRFMNRRVQ